MRVWVAFQRSKPVTAWQRVRNYWFGIHYERVVLCITVPCQRYTAAAATTTTSTSTSIVSSAPLPLPAAAFALARFSARTTTNTTTPITTTTTTHPIPVNLCPHCQRSLEAARASKRKLIEGSVTEWHVLQYSVVWEKGAAYHIDQHEKLSPDNGWDTLELPSLSTDAVHTLMNFLNTSVDSHTKIQFNRWGYVCNFTCLRHLFFFCCCFSSSSSLSNCTSKIRNRKKHDEGDDEDDDETTTEEGSSSNAKIAHHHRPSMFCSEFVCSAVQKLGYKPLDDIDPKFVSPTSLALLLLRIPGVHSTTFKSALSDNESARIHFSHTK